MPAGITKILLVEDDPDVAEMLTAYFHLQNYELIAVNQGEEGVRLAGEIQPDLLILDIHLPDIDGFEVARRVRNNRHARSIPIIFLTEKQEHIDRMQGLELGAEDFITKPFDVLELRLRVRNTIQRANQESLTNPVTNLPDGQLVSEKLEECVKRAEWAALIISLENIDLFREAYGFVASDDVLRAVSLLISNVMREMDNTDAFLGHISSTDFVLLTTGKDLSILQEKIQTRIEQSLDYFYPIKDREQIPLGGNKLAVKLGAIYAGDSVFLTSSDLRLALLRKKA